MALERRDFTEMSPPTLLVSIQMSALINHLSESPPPSHASAKTQHTTQHTSRLSNRALSTGSLRIEKLQYALQYSERILEECHQSFIKLNHFWDDIKRFGGLNWISRSHGISTTLIDISIICHVPINVYHLSIKLQIENQHYQGLFFWLLLWKRFDWGHLDS